MKRSCAALLRVGLFVALLAPVALAAEPSASSWSNDPVWHDGLVEKAVYAASRVVYEKPRAYEAVFFTNKEQHDRKTLTKAQKSTDTVEVWKFNQVEVIPTPNYDYKYVTTSHFSVDSWFPTRLDCTSQEFCGTSFKQYLLKVWPGNTTGLLDYWGFSYMPEAGRVSGLTEAAVVPADALPLWLRDFDFAAKATVKFKMLPSQKSNRPTEFQPVEAETRYVGVEGDAHKLEVHVAGKLIGTYWMATDASKRHLMLKYRGVDGQQYDLKSIERVNYWTIKE